MSEVERVEGAEGNERTEGVAGIEGVESYCTTERLWIHPPMPREVHLTNLVALRYWGKKSTYVFAKSQKFAHDGRGNVCILRFGEKQHRLHSRQSMIDTGNVELILKILDRTDATKHKTGSFSTC